MAPRTCKPPIDSPSCATGAPAGDRVEVALAEELQLLLELADPRVLDLQQLGGVDTLEENVAVIQFPIELSAAASQASNADGYLSLLREFIREVEEEEHRAGTYRALIAPEVDRLLIQARQLSIPLEELVEQLQKRDSQLDRSEARS